MMHDSIEVTVLARLIFKGRVISSKRNSVILNRYETARWIVRSIRKNEFLPRSEALESLNERLSTLCPNWLADSDFLRSISRDPFNPSDIDAVFYLRKTAAPREFINRRNWNAAKGLGPKHKPKLPAPKNITKDWILRFRANKGLCISKNNEIVNCDQQMKFFTEISLPERAWLTIEAFGGALPKTIVSCENLGAYIDLPVNSETLVVYVPGIDIDPVVKLLRSIPSGSWVHFGDLDHEGLEIANKIAQRSERPLNLYVPTFSKEYIDGAPRMKTTWNVSSDVPTILILQQSNKRIFQEVFMLDARLRDDFSAHCNDKSDIASCE